ncbi:Superoxide dismutase [Cu-Zn] B [Anthophora quadrimaculata]
MWWLFLLNYVTVGYALRLAAYISSGGLHGEIQFEKVTEISIRMRFSFQATLQYPDQQWFWSVTQFPVDYTLVNNRCDRQHIGESIINLTELVGPLDMPGNQTGSIEVSGVSLTGQMGLWGKGLILQDVYSDRIICASITVLEKNIEKFAQAQFYETITGTVLFRWLEDHNGDNTNDTLIYVDLYHVNNRKLQNTNYTEHNWKIYVTDAFDVSKDKSSCNILQTVFDLDHMGNGRAIGDIDMRLGKIKIATNHHKRYKTSYRDSKLSVLPADLLGPHHQLYLVIFHPTHEDSFLVCSKIIYKKPIFVKTLINSHGIKGEVSLMQVTPFDPTWVNISLTPIHDLETRLRYATKIKSYRIHELPPDPTKVLNETTEICKTTKEMYNPTNINIMSVPPAGFGTQDQYAIGDLSGKLQGRKEGSYHYDILSGSAKLSGIYWDVYLPLSGVYSVAHRSLVLHKYNETDNKSIIPWVCGTFHLYSPDNTGQIPILSAQVVFRYPIVGKIIFRQPKNDPQMDTTIIIENLIHADGNAINNSAHHRWMIHENPPGKDYYNWTGRCLSTGEPYNPYKVEWNSNLTEYCSMSESVLCRVGDLTRHNTIDIAGKKLYGSLITRKLFTDTMLTLSGPNNILGKSLVIYDDNGPRARGERLACSIINQIYRRKAVAKNWFGNGEIISLKGKLEFIQQTEYDITNGELNLDGLNGKMSGYHVHMTPIEQDLEFPCESTSLYDHWNPLNVNINNVPRPGEGTIDQYEMGDLSGKFGTLENKKKYMTSFNDTMLSLFGPNSILGRSIVIHKKEKNLRWACTTIERGYSPSEASERRAIASFHHPQGFAYGYIRMTQLIHQDGSQSETIIEVKLRHPGKHDRNITRNHNWAIYVNPIGVDAAVKVKDTRCVAGGYIWNPYFTQLADPLNDDLYRQECGPDLPLRCYIGDISGRLGPIDIGLKRQVFTDSNFPLAGPISAIGRSIIIFDQNFGTNRFACANIEPDNDIIKYTNIRKPPRFVVAQFLGDVRKVMGIPDWMLSIDNRKTKILHNGACIQFLLHFKGPIANKLEHDFNKLMSTGRLDAPSLYIPGYVSTNRKATLGYRQCGNRDPNYKSSNFLLPSISSLLHPEFILIVTSSIIIKLI